jgi:hypothetical protein
VPRSRKPQTGIYAGGNAIADVTQSKLNKWTAQNAHHGMLPSFVSHITDSLDTTALPLEQTPPARSVA